MMVYYYYKFLKVCLYLNDSFTYVLKFLRQKSFKIQNNDIRVVNFI